MKIGFVLDDGLDKPDGVQQYIRTLGDWFENSGHEVHFLVGETKRRDIENVHSLAKNIKVKFNGNALTIPLPASKKRIKKVIKELKLDVIHVQVPYSPFMGAKVISVAGPETVVIGTFHILPYGIASQVGTKLLGIWLKSNIKRFDHMVSVSGPAAVFAETHFGVKSSVVPNSVNMEIYAPKTIVKKDKSKLRLLFLGRLVERKGCKQFLQALILLNETNRLPANTQIDICGDGQQRQMLEKIVKDNNLSKLVRFHGFVTLEEKVDFMQKADISIFPSLSGESFGIVLIEAMAAAGGIVLAGNNPGYESVLGDIDGSIIDAKKPDVMANQIASFMHDSSMRSKLYDLQQKHVQQFDTPVVARQLLRLYSDKS